MDAHTIDLDYGDRKVWYLGLFSDIHLEAADHDSKLFHSDMQEAVKLDARILINGDLCDLILPTDRKRFTSGKHAKKVDAILTYTAEMTAKALKPYADYIDVIGVGNHETAVLKYHHDDIVLRVITLLQQWRSKTLQPIHHGGYKGYTRYRFSDNGGRVRTYDILRFHGAGSAAEVTKGMIDFNRLRQTYRADLYWVGHKHTHIADHGMCEIGLNREGEIVKRDQKGVITAGYMKSVTTDDYSDGYVLSYSETKRTPQAQGCAFLRLALNNKQRRIVARVIQ